MEPITTVVWCDGTCDLAPEEHAREHPNPHDVLRERLVNIVNATLALGASGETVTAAVLAEIEVHPVLEIRPSYPTQDAYELACATLNQRITQLDEVKRLHGKPRTDRYASGCVQCGIVWPCPTAKAVGITDPRPDRQGPLPS